MAVVEDVQALREDVQTLMAAQAQERERVSRLDVKVEESIRSIDRHGATKADVEKAKADVEKAIGAVRSDVETLKVSVQSDVETVKVSLQSDVETVKVSLQSDVETVKVSLQSDIRVLRIWLFVGLAGLAVLELAVPDDINLLDMLLQLRRLGGG